MMLFNLLLLQILSVIVRLNGERVNKDMKNEFVFTAKSLNNENFTTVISESEFNENYVDPSFGWVSTIGAMLDGNHTGWHVYREWTNESHTEEGAYEIGKMEGGIACFLVHQHWHNTIHTFCEKHQETCEKIRNYIKENTKWVRKMINLKKKSSDYWYQVHLIYRQLDGVYEAYNEYKYKWRPNITFEDFVFMNIAGDSHDLEKKFIPEESHQSNFFETHSSALIKLLPENKGLIAGHTTSARYGTMIRVAKKYGFNYETRLGSKTFVPGINMTFSGHAPLIHSTDSFYAISNGLVIMKTSFDNNNRDLWKSVKPQGTVFEFVRVLVANRLAKCGQSWTEIFSKYNSGTSNGQYMIIDYKKFTKGQTPEKGLLWVLEQLPGHTKAEDQTEILKKTSYWASYNIPFYENIFKLSGYEKLVKKYGPWFGYNTTPRAQIFKRDHESIKCCCGMMTLLRSNNYKHDPLSKCKCKPGGYSASNAISPRQDLNSPHGSYPIPFLACHPSGSIDAKVITDELIKDLSFNAVNGPTTGTDLPVFKWSKSGFAKSVNHFGHVDKWQYKTKLIKFW